MINFVEKTEGPEPRRRIAAIVPAYNEEKNVGNVLKVLLSSKDLDEVILVDDGSTDKTAEIGKNLGVKVLKLSENKGKGNAMKQGLNATNAEIIVFFDADLIGLSQKHIYLLLEPMVKDNADMCVGIRDRFFGFPKLVVKIDPLLAIGGERAIKRAILEDIPEKFIQKFAVELALNHYCINKKLLVKYVKLPKLSIIIKEKKYGFCKGFISRVKMVGQIIKIRLQLCIKKQL
ncbi:MAG: glycosyltransferase family 2 protein [Candidatus Staskawiczbacteria bacterium]|nr:glycosyltransferase family 2 protein [Candidatus Staskawiczbacteria bacterium]